MALARVAASVVFIRAAPLTSSTEPWQLAHHRPMHGNVADRDVKHAVAAALAAAPAPAPPAFGAKALVAATVFLVD